MASPSAAVPSFGPPTDDRSYQLHISGGVMLALAAIFLALRLVTRLSLTTAGMWVDDWLIIVAFVFQLGFTISAFIMINFGLGRHVDLANTFAVQSFLKTYIPAASFYALSYGFTKLSILAFYLRIFGRTNKIRWPAYILAFITIGWAISVVLVSIFSCQPVAYWWDRAIPNGHCVDNKAFLLGNSLPNMITDWIIIAMPLPLIWGLQQSIRQKLVLTGCFLLGGFVCIVTIVRLVIQLKTDYNSPDLPWTVVDFVIWTNVETGTAIIGACLPSLRPVWVFLRTGRKPYSKSGRIEPAANANSAHRMDRSKFHNNKQWQTIGTSNNDLDGLPLVQTKINAQPSAFKPKPSEIHVTTEHTIERD